MQKNVAKAGGSKVTAFFKRNIYYVLMIVCVLAIGSVITVAAVMNSNKNVDVIVPPDDGTGTVTPPTVNPDPEKPEFLLVSPVANGQTQLVFNNTELVFDKTENKYYTHLGVDFMGAAGTDVLAPFAGTVKSVTQDSYKGTVVVIEHQDGYVSTVALLKDVTVKASQKIEKGAVIGKIGEAYSFESKEGTHVHYELSLNGATIDPTQFLPGSDK